MDEGADCHGTICLIDFLALVIRDENKQGRERQKPCNYTAPLLYSASTQRLTLSRSGDFGNDRSSGCDDKLSNRAALNTVSNATKRKSKTATITLCDKGCVGKP
ncbi:hypothetical protein RRG08_048677 [Elysia crispata]|uniref:Uncharacterized protein n=1 Tax=Elysia crispata TaxID=231223 RepID=A0AAE1ACY1_9GAST|nr:hypothetical protein RRG08_048677 [Elysia crispata]